MIEDERNQPASDQPAPELPAPRLPAPEPLKPPPRRAPTKTRVPPYVLVAGALGASICLLALVALLGTRLGLWSHLTGIAMLRWVVYGALLTMIVAGLAMYRTRPGMGRPGFPLAMLALVTGLVLAIVPIRESRIGLDAPPIHDITTDLDNPPRFVAIVPLRADAPNPPDHGGPEVIRQQLAAYPDIRPVIVDLPSDRAFRRAVEVATTRGWRIVEANELEGRIEATDRTFWLGLPEDVVIRLTPLDGRTVVDVRSSSRVVEGDRGSNARRVRDFLLDVQS